MRWVIHVNMADQWSRVIFAGVQGLRADVRRLPIGRLHHHHPPGGGAVLGARSLQLQQMWCRRVAQWPGCDGLILWR